MERLFNKPPCDRCKKLKGDKWDAEDCKICLPPSLPENADAHMIYGLICDQYIMGPMGPVAINQGPIHQAMDLYEVEDRRTCFEKVLKLGRHFTKART